MTNQKKLAIVGGSVAVLLGLLLLVRGESRPPWATQKEGTKGDGTVTGAGEPLGVGRAPNPPTLDGKLDEGMWASAAIAGPFVHPGDGQDAPKHPTFGTARMLWDDQHLYLGFVVDDRNPSSPFQPTDVDPRIWEKSSAIEVMFQPGEFADNRHYFEMQIDVASAVFDTRWDDYNQPITGGPDEASKVFGHMDWSSKLERGVYVKKGEFYSVEVAIPWSSLGTPRTKTAAKAGDVHRLNLYTFRDGQRAAAAWSPIKGQGNFHRSARFGRIKLL